MKYKMLICIMLMFLLTTVAPAWAIDVVVHDEKLSLDQEPILEQGRTLVPIRAIFEALGADVTYDAAQGYVMAVDAQKDVFLLLWLDRTTYTTMPYRVFSQGMADGTFAGDKLLPTLALHAKASEVPTRVVNGRTLVPLRMVAETFGAKVDWHEATRTVYVNSIIPETPAVRTDVQSATVTGVTDGDTIRATMNGTVYKIRLIGVDTPEVYGQPEFFGKEASAYTKSLLPVGATIYQQKDVSDTDRYGRLLRYVWLEPPASPLPSEDDVAKHMVNALLISGGYGAPATYAPDVRYDAMFRVLAQPSRDHGWGLWARPENQAASAPVAV